MLRNWELKLVLDRASQASLGAQIVRVLIDDISGGRVAPGTVLPGSRVLAGRLGVSRKTVVEAYDELASQGWIVSEPQRGTFVASALPASGPLAPLTGPRMAAACAVAFRGTAPCLSHEPPEAGTILLDDGLPDGRLLPTALLARAYAQALASSAATNDLGYGDPRGDAGLREAIASMLTLERGIACGPEHICLTRGSQMAIHLILRLFAGRGDTVAVERLGYGPVRDMAHAVGAEAAPVALDEQGMDLRSLEVLCRNRRVRIVYVTPHHQYPTAVSMRPERRMQLLVLAAQFGFIVLEDDYDHEFHFEGRPLLPLMGADRDGRVAYVGSFSKLLSPSLRLGYVAGTPDLIDRLSRDIMMFDRQGDPVTERAVALLMQTGVVRSHARRVLRIYAQRRLDAARLLRQHCSRHFEVETQAGGLALWARFKTTIDPARLRTSASANGVSLLPVRQFAIDGDGASGVRIGFASLEGAEFAEAVRRLSRAADDALSAGT